MLRFARNDDEILKRHTTVVPREGGGSSTPRLLGSIIGVSGILDRPPSRTMTVEYDFAISRRDTPEVCLKTSRPLNQRAQGRPGACCTRGLACDFAQTKVHTSIQGSGNTPAFPAQWLYGLLRALPGERLFCLRYPKEASLLLDVMPAPRHQNHTTSPYASGAYVYRAFCVHRISPRVRDDGQRPSSAVRRAELCR